MTTTLVRRNDAPWLTAGRGLIHNERPGGGRSTYSSGAGNLVQAQPYAVTISGGATTPSTGERGRSS